MKLVCESSNLEDYLLELPEVSLSDTYIQQKADELFERAGDKLSYVKIAYEFVRDNISHSWDIQSTKVTKTASDVLREQEGICYAKSNLLASLLRSKGIPTGFCYQRLMLFDTPEKGYCIHALNAVYLECEEKWVRLDARGNKKNVQAEFSVNDEKLAFPVSPEFDEIDYPTIYTTPNRATMKVLDEHTNCLDMYLHFLPECIG